MLILLMKLYLRLQFLSIIWDFEDALAGIDYKNQNEKGI